jgi:hypothetical protein
MADRKPFNWATDSLNAIWNAHHNAHPRSHSDFMYDALLPKVRFYPAVPLPAEKPTVIYPGGREYSAVNLEGWNKSGVGGWSIPSRLSR